MTSNSRYSMLDSMDIRCARCGYENNPQFRFCGMCGAALRPRDPEHREEPSNAEFNSIAQRLMDLGSPAPVDPMPVEPLIAELTASQKMQTEQTSRAYSRESRDESHVAEPFHGQRTPIPVSGPSFLGLSDASDDRRVEYLLEDEPHPGRSRRIVGTLLLATIVAVGILYWRKSGYVWPLNRKSELASTKNTPDSSGQNVGVVPSEVTPKVAKQEKSEQSKTETVEKPLTPDTNIIQTDSAASETQNPGNIPSPRETPVTTPGNAESTESPASPPVEKIPSLRAERTQTHRTKPASAKPSRLLQVPPNPAEDSLFLQGQKYLYGGAGVAANCARAQQYLTSSANNSNPRAESTLGTMYATGHCAQRDLPLAYRWFARALRVDARNTRLERDVQMMWQQMTPPERTLALKNE